MEIVKQVDRDHYDFSKYVKKNHRWISFYHQLDELFKLRPDSVLEVGPGMPLVRGMLNFHLPHVTYKSLDIAEDLNPDIFGPVTAIPLEDNSFDVVCAFQVLEHIPFDLFPVALKEMHRVAKKHVIISLPHYGPAVRFLLKIPGFHLVEFAYKVPFPRNHVWKGEHYWEIGKRGYPASRIRNVMREYFIVKKEYIPFENQCHRFYVLEKK